MVLKMISELEVKNLLSLRNVRLKLGKFNALIGPNLSGKSNIVKVLHLVKFIFKGHNIEEIVRVKFGFKEVKDIIYGFSTHESASVRLKGSINESTIEYFIEFDGTGKVLHEFLKVNDLDIMRREEASCTLFDEKMFVDMHLTAIKHLKDRSGKNVDGMRISDVIEFFGSISTYSFNPPRMKSSSSSGLSVELEYDGRNIAQVLHTILTTDRRKFFQIEEVVRSLIPEIQELDVIPSEDGQQVEVGIREEGIGEIVPASNISDGTLRIIALVTALHLCSSVVIFEEPENFVHPRLYETFVDLCRKSPPQVIITTHSPYLLDKLKPEEVIIVEKRKGETVTKKIDDEKLIKKGEISADRGKSPW